MAMQHASLVLLFTVTGCFGVRPITVSAPQPGQRLIAYLNEPIEFQVVEARLSNLVRVEGQLLRQTPDSLVLAAEALWSRIGVRHPALGSRIALYKPHITQVMEKRMSALRTGLLFAAGGGILALIMVTLGSSGGGGITGDGGGATPF